MGGLSRSSSLRSPEPVPVSAHTGDDRGRKLTVLSLFAGIGGFDLGLERTGGFETVAFCEIEPFAQRVLAKHWPEVPVYGDVRQLTAERLRADGIVPDVIVGGFPCQDISVAGKGAGLAGERSGLWSEIVRLAGEIRPAFLILENVSALLGRGLGDVLGDLASVGYDAEWHCIPATYVGAPHRRDRVWIVAHAGRAGLLERRLTGDAPSQSLFAGRMERNGVSQRKRREGEALAHANNQSQERPSEPWCEHDPWAAEPDMGRVAHGIPRRVDRLRCLGNAVVPQIPELIGRAILSAIAAATGTAECEASQSGGDSRIARKASPETPHGMH